MLKVDYVTLRLVGIMRSEAWPDQPQGFSSFLVQSGIEQFAYCLFVQSLRTGEVLVSNSSGEGMIATIADETIFWRFSVCLENLFLASSLGRMAHKFSCSRCHPHRLFHQHFGRSRAVLKMKMRLLKAIGLLHGPDQRIFKVAKQRELNHLGLVNNSFKRRFSKTPMNCPNRA
jgi:AraC-like DNA-binding protein